MSELLLEVRAEEIPARMVAPAARQLAGRLFEDLTTHGLGPREVESAFTPRRLVVVLRGLPEREADREETVMGPPASVAYKDGAPTPALEGFARRCGVAPEALERVQTEKGEYVAAVQQVKGRSTREVLAELLPAVIAELSWAKNMRWGSGDGPWVRPVHGVVALLDGEVIPFELFGLASGRTTIGHPILSPEPFEVEGAEDYHARLAALGLEIRPAERRRRLAEAMAARAEAAGGRLVEDAELLDKLTAICEIPGVVEGRFEERFLELPREVLVTSLKDHQSAFTVETETGKKAALAPLFLTLMDRPDDPIGRVKAGNEWVVAARLADARFFYQEDRKVGLAARAEQLERLTFHVRLGSYAAKTRRLVALAEHLCHALGRDGDLIAARRAAQLLKADLPTEMVKEFTSLEGVVGGIYAREEGEAAAVWQAVYDHYRPASTDDELPRGWVGRIVALADRLDTLAGMFGLGLVPSGSKDPFGLRRAGQGVVRILLEGGIPLDWQAAAKHAAGLYGDIIERSPSEVLELVRPFLLDRVRYLLGQQGFAYDEIEAAMAAGSRDLPMLADRVAAVQSIRQDPSFLSVALSARRIANILKGQAPQELSPQALVEPAEKALHQAYGHLAADTEAAISARDFRRALEGIGGLAEGLERFFEEVMVMAEDETLRRQRIALLQALDRVISRIAHLPELVVDKAEHRQRSGAA